MGDFGDNNLERFSPDKVFILEFMGDLRFSPVEWSILMRNGDWYIPRCHNFNIFVSLLK